MKQIIALTIQMVIVLAGATAQVLTPVVDSIPVRDGKKIAADRYVPPGCTSCPVILIQTPYNRLFFRLGLPLGVGTNLAASNYAFVVTDWRGFYGSSAAAAAGASQGEDGYDIVEWIAQQLWCNTMVGTWGPSALGRVQYTTMRENPPSLRCAVPLVAGPQFSYLEYYPGGVIRTEYVQQLDALGFGMSAILYANPVRNLTWQLSEAATFYPAQITKPVLMIGGWYDHNTDVMLAFFNGIRQSSPVNVRDKHRLLMGPWVHGGSGPAYVGSAVQGQLSYPNAAGWNDSLALLFFDYHLRGVANGWDQTPFVNYYQMGEDAWHSAAQWPAQPVSNVPWYLQPGGTLATTLSPSATASLNIPYDPADPSPTVGGTTLRTDLDQGPYDQAPVVEMRNDVAIFSTPVLSGDLVLQGSVTAELYVTSDRLDTDFAVRLIDKYPDGRSMLITDGIRRLRFRNGYTAADTSNITPGSVHPLNITLPPTSITIKQGHRLQIDISGSIYPKYDSNLNNGQQMYVAGDTLTALNTLFVNNVNPSRIVLPQVTTPLAAGEGQAHPALQIFPNPSTGRIRVLCPEGELSGEVTVEILNLAGQPEMKMQTICNNGYLDMDAAALMPGLHILQVRTRSGTHQYAKIAISRP